ncbi:MAG: STAS domain-containing protein [Planctomycetota bacterium]|jgi:anti-anti-sigma factor
MVPKITIEYTQNATIVTFVNKTVLEEWDIQTLQELVEPVIKQTKRIKLIINFYNVRLMPSIGLGVLVRISKNINEREGQLRLCNLSPKIYEIFEITRLTRAFEIHPDLKSAVKSLSTSEHTGAFIHSP